MYKVLQSLFGSPSGKGKRVTKEEMKRIMSGLYGKLDAKERAEVERMFIPHLHEEGIEKGISREEFEQAMQWTQENLKHSVLEENDLSEVRRRFEEHLQD